MVSNNKSNKADKPVDQAEGFTETAAVVENTKTLEVSENGVNDDRIQSTDVQIELPVVIDTETQSELSVDTAAETDASLAATKATEQLTELQKLVDAEVKEVEEEIEALKDELKEKRKRMRELLKKPNASGPTKKEQAHKWLVSHPDAKLIEYIHYAVGELGISPVYANTVFQEAQKSKSK
jgi:transcriptional regulator with GAF, ATPase, and Fis domain